MRKYLSAIWQQVLSVRGNNGSDSKKRRNSNHCMVYIPFPVVQWSCDGVLRYAKAWLRTCRALGDSGS